MDRLTIRPSHDQAAWDRALHGLDDGVLAELVASEPPGVIAFQCGVAINGMYRAVQLRGASLAEVTPKVARAARVTTELRRRLGPEQREIDLGLLRWIRRASALSAVLGAGVTMGAGGPSWSDLVRRLLVIALEQGHEITERVRVPTDEPDTITSEARVSSVERFDAVQEKEARAVVAAIDAKSADTETLMRGAELCLALFGQHMFTHVTQILYEGDRKPSAVHHAIAELARPIAVPDRGPGLFPGWDSIVTYNFDDLMGEALDERQLARAAWAMRGPEKAGDPNAIARKGGQNSLFQSIYHLHGYTPRRFFLITTVGFVFSTSQYENVYAERRALLDEVLTQYLANPVHYALYVGCSFTDEAMNDLLREAAVRLPGRTHYALLRWPGATKYERASNGEIERESARFVAFGVQPIWFDDFSEMPALIGRLA
jgi:hypothetical protein